MVLPNPGSDPALPGGCSYGTMRLSASGLISFAGTLADGTKVTQASALSTQALWPLHIPLYAGRGLLWSWMALDRGKSASDLSGMLTWIKQSNPQARYYPGGFTNDYRGLGFIYLQPSPRDAPLLNPSQTVVSFYGGNLSSDLEEQIELGPYSRVTDKGPSGLAMTFSLATGLFTGTVTDPATHRPVPFAGAVSTKMNMGFGLSLGADQTGRVIINP